MYPVQAYHCSYCKVFKLRKSAAINHENKCFYNPATMSCATCLFYDVNESIKPYKGLICHKGVNFYPANVERPKLQTGCTKWVERPEDEEEKINLLMDYGYTPHERPHSVPVIDQSRFGIDLEWIEFNTPF